MRYKKEYFWKDPLYSKLTTFYKLLETRCTLFGTKYTLETTCHTILYVPTLFWMVNYLLLISG